MNKSNGFLLVQDIVVFALCSILLLASAVTWKTCIMRRQQYKEITEAIAAADSFLAEKIEADSKITVNYTETEIGTLAELQIWKDVIHGTKTCNFFVFKN